jgi:hypothetical protein
MLARPFPANQMPWRRECSEGLYQIPVIKLKPGLMMLSKTPSRILRIKSDVKLDDAPWHIRTMDQQRTAVERYLPRGNLTKPTEPGKLATRYPK